MKLFRILCLCVVLSLFLGPMMAFSDDQQAYEQMKAWLAKVVAEQQSKGWTGIETTKLDKPGAYYSKVTSVAAGSPAEKAGFQAGDILFAINGVQLTEENLAALKAAKKGLTAGSVVTYSVKRQQGEEWTKAELKVELGPMPQEILARSIGMMVLREFGPDAKAAAKDSH